ncbi:polysaccharide deacetylase family protein [Candidatus Woesearchaeota archaeon]|nr:polysaccharide deacetylase family protein [Candidatus Woesearchaeota archaeon]
MRPLWLLLPLCLLFLLLLSDYLIFDSANDLPPPVSRTVLLGFDLEEPDTDEDVAALLDLLEAHSASATFFVVGKVAEERPELMRSILAAGHELACHSYSHPQLTGLSEAGQREELTRCAEALQGLGIEHPGFRAPYTRTDRHLVSLLAGLGYAYDASYIEEWTHAPRAGVPGIKVSASFLPLTDYYWLYLLRSPGPFYAALRGYPASRLLSVDLHPRYVMRYPSHLGAYLAWCEEAGCAFLSHQELMKG